MRLKWRGKAQQHGTGRADSQDLFKTIPQVSVPHLGTYKINWLVADITDLHYYLYKEDAARAAAIGVTAHSFS